MIKLLMIADDFTGGLDSGVQLAQKGVPTVVVTDPELDYAEAAQQREVLVVVAETRHLTATEAYQTVYQIVKKGVALGVRHIYKKTDSGLRGNIGAELSAALHASGQRSLFFFPALPAMNRITRGGVHYVEGKPVAESFFAQDPFEPVTESDVCRLLALQTKEPTRSVAPDALPDNPGILVVDAEKEEDLWQAGRQLSREDRLRVMAGCAGFSACLPELLGLTKRELPTLPDLGKGLFTVCGSVSPVSQRQLDIAEKNGFKRVHILPEQKLTPHYFDTGAGKEALQRWNEMNRENAWFILDANDTDDGNADTHQLASDLGLSSEDVRSRISGALGKAVSQMLRESMGKALLIIGGDTLLQCMKNAQVCQMEPLREIFPGVVLSRFEAQGQPHFIITKSGGFGKETLLTDLRKMIGGENAYIL